jgi:amino acid transporter
MALAVTIWSGTYDAVVALSVIALYSSYGLPVLLGLRRRDRRRGPWSLGAASRTVNVVALAWIAICMVLFVLPPNELAGYTFAGSLAALAVYWRYWMRDRFRGPPAALIQPPAD